MPAGSRDDPKLLVDTSVAVALVVTDHEQHRRTFQALGDRRTLRSLCFVTRYGTDQVGAERMMAVRLSAEVAASVVLLIAAHGSRVAEACEQFAQQAGEVLLLA